MTNQINPAGTIVLTGATSGIGRHAALHLLRRSPATHLVVVGRSNLAATVEELRADSGNTHVEDVTADLSSIDSTRAAVAALRTTLADMAVPPLVGIVANAGVQQRDATSTSPDGLELTFAVNVVSNHLLVAGLLDTLQAPARIVITSSDTHFGDFSHNLGTVPAPRWEHPSSLALPKTGPDAASPAAGRRAYSTSKLAVIYLVHAWARRLPPGVEIVAFNPGLVPGTGLARHAGPATRFAFGRILPKLTFLPFVSSAETAGTNLAAATIGSTPGGNGSYINGDRVERSSAQSYDPDREETLFDELQRLTHPDPMDHH